MCARRTALLICLGLVALTLASFASVLENDFVNVDDPQYVSQNPQVQGGLSWDGVRWAFTTLHAGYWIPLCWLSLQLDAQVFGAGPWGFHLTNLLLHAANVVLLFLALYRMTGAVWRSAFVAAAFAVHPLHVESVAWVTERKDVLSTFFGLLALWAYAWYAELPSLRRYLLVAVAFALSLLAKPMLVTLPCLLLLLDYWPLRRFPARAAPGAETTPDTTAQVATATSWRWLLLEKVPLLGLTAVSSVIAVITQHAGGALVTDERLSLSYRLANAVLSYAVYLRKAVWPSDLAVFYPYNSAALFGWQFWVAVVVLGLVTALATVLGRRVPALLVGWLWYLGTLVPVIGLVQVGEQALADRFTYFPLIGVFVAVAWSVPTANVRALRRPERGALGAQGFGWALAGVAGAVVFVWALESRADVRYWRDSRTLWERALEVVPDNYLACENLGRILLVEGEVPRAEGLLIEAVRLRPRNASFHYGLAVCYLKTARLDDAEHEYLEAIALDPGDANAHNDLGLICQQKGREDEALDHFQTALRSNPGLVQAHNNLGMLLLRRGQNEDALGHFTAAIQLAPDKPSGHQNLGLALGCAGNWPAAAAALRDAVRLQPPNAVLLALLAHALHESGQAEAAERAYRAALQVNPQWPAQFASDAWQLATTTTAAQRNGALAMQLASAACQGTGGQQPEPLEALAAVLAAAGRFDEAAAAMRRALDLTPTNQPNLVARRRQCLQQLLNRQPLRLPADGDARRP